MLVKNLEPWAGELFSYRPGEIVELSEEIAVARIAAGLAEAIPEEPKAKTRKTEVAA